MSAAPVRPDQCHDRVGEQDEARYGADHQPGATDVTRPTIRPVPVPPVGQDDAMTDLPDVRIVHLDGAAFRALAAGDLITVGEVPASPYLAGPQCRGLWRMRAAQCESDPASAAWVTGIIRDERLRVAVGAAGFHGPPDASGMVEIGYRVDPAHRRRGYARAAFEALLERAAREPAVRRVRVTISPGNLPSLSLIGRYGFVRIGEQWDDEDGPEDIYEIQAAG